MYASVSPWDLATSSKVPIFEDGPTFRLVESGVIADFINAKYPLPTAPPTTPEQMAIERLFVDTFEKTIGGLSKPILQAAGDEAACAKVVESMKTNIPIMETFFVKHCSSSGPFVGGEAFSYAEMMTAPFIQRLLPVAKHFLGVDGECVVNG
jgi:glutathione S-transferase